MACLRRYATTVQVAADVQYRARDVTTSGILSSPDLPQCRVYLHDGDKNAFRNFVSLTDKTTVPCDVGVCLGAGSVRGQNDIRSRRRVCQAPQARRGMG